MTNVTLLEEARRLEIRLWGLAVGAARRYKRRGDKVSEAEFARMIVLQSKAQRRYSRRWVAFRDGEE